MQRCRRQRCHPVAGQGPLLRELPGKVRSATEVRKEQLQSLKHPHPPWWSPRNLPLPTDTGKLLLSSLLQPQDLWQGQAHGTLTFPTICCWRKDWIPQQGPAAGREGWGELLCRYLPRHLFCSGQIEGGRMSQLPEHQEEEEVAHAPLSHLQAKPWGTRDSSASASEEREGNCSRAEHSRPEGGWAGREQAKAVDIAHSQVKTHPGCRQPLCREGAGIILSHHVQSASSGKTSPRNAARRRNSWRPRALEDFCAVFCTPSGTSTLLPGSQPKLCIAHTNNSSHPSTHCQTAQNPPDFQSLEILFLYHFPVHSTAKFQ